MLFAFGSTDVEVGGSAFGGISASSMCSLVVYVFSSAEVYKGFVLLTRKIYFYLQL